MKKVAFKGGLLIDGTGAEPVVNSLVMTRLRTPVRTRKSDLTTRLWILPERLLCLVLLTPICIFQET